MAGAEPPVPRTASELAKRRAGARRQARRRRVTVVAVLVLVAGGGAAAGLVAAGSGRDAGPAPQASAPAQPVGADRADQVATSTPADAPLDIDGPRGKAAWPQRGAAARRVRVPIVMYHLVGEPKGQVAYPDLWVTPANFRAQVAALKDAGFVAITMAELWDAWHGDGALPRRPVVLSFDDGDLSQVMNAAPVLSEAGWPGVLNLTLNHLGNDGLPRWGVKRMLRQGWELGSHTIEHPDMTTLGPDAMRRELEGSRKAIKDEFGVDADFFCYPAGRHDAAVRAAAEVAGYTGATTTEPGLAARSDDPFALPRVRVQAATTASGLVDLARG